MKSRILKSGGVLLLAVGLWSSLSTAALATNPALGAITPYGFRRGTQVEVTFSGNRLGDIEQLHFYSPGIEVAKLEAPDDNQVKATLNIDPACRLGIHAVRLRTKTGISNLRTFTIGALPEIAEVEPNSQFEQPQAIETGVTVSGVVENEDVDHFVVEAKKGQRITAELEGLRLGYTFFDPYLAILNEQRFELARSDDAALLRQDCICSIVAPEDGKYIVQIRESAYGGDGNCKYRLHIGSFPRPRAVYPSGGRPGETMEITWLGDELGPKKQSITLPAAENGQHELFAEDEQGIAPSPNLFRVVDLPNVLEAEPNNDRDAATAGEAPAAFNGIIESPGDVDYFKFKATKGQVYDIRVWARDVLRSPLDSVLVVQRSNGAGVASNDDNGGPDSYLRFTAPEDDEYLLQVYDHLSTGGPNYVYRVEVAPVQPALTMSLPEVQRYVSTTLEVPQGNRMALMVNAGRANFGGDLQVTVEGLPPGLTVEPTMMTGGQTSIPMLFTAAADAPTGGALADLVGRTTDPNLNIVGHLDQRTQLVSGQNNVDVWGHNADRMAVALTEKVPYEIEIAQPQVPIVRNGEMGLKVIAKRAEGFNAAIALRLLYNPPGIGSSGSISIPADASEAVIPLTANNGAGIGTWPIVVIGSAPVGNGTAEIATQMATLEISDSLFTYEPGKAAAEQGKQAELMVKVNQNIAYDETVEVELVGLPANTSVVEKLQMTKDTTELIFKIDVTAEAKPGRYTSLLCRSVQVRNGEPIVHTMASGELRVDVPLPPKPDAPQPAPEAKPEPEKKPAERPLTRLEQLRLERAKAKGDDGQ